MSPKPLSLERLLLVCFVLLLASCGQDASDKEGSTYSKEEARALNGSLPDGRDLCDVANWYGDGECDPFCPLPDSDCACQADSDCAVGEVCTSGECGPAPIPACAADPDCPAGEACVDGQCQTIMTPPGCTSDADCTDTEFCGSAGECLPKEMAPPECQADVDCAAGQICVDGACEPDNTPQCSTDADCADTEFCHTDGECLPIEMAPLQCQVDSDCAAGETCVNGECHTPNICQSNDDCAVGQMCDDTSRCVDWICGGFAGFQCPETHYCDFDESIGTACGAADGTGICTPRPEVCNTRFDPVCGCDGMDYSNPCNAFAAGTDYWNKGSCQP